MSLSEVSPIALSHDSISRWLTQAHIQPKLVWKEVKKCILGTEGIIAIDDTVLNKGRSNKMELVRWQYSGTEHDIVKGIGMVNFLWVNEKGEVTPMDVRIWEPKEDGKTKNELVREVLALAKRREVTPEVVVADSWYSSLDNLKCIRDLGWEWMMGLKKNRVVNRGEKLSDLTIPEEGSKVHLRGYGFIHVFRFVAKNGRTDYFGTSIVDPTKKLITSLRQKRWNIEVFHRELKQTCGLECSQARSSRTQRNHIVCSVLAFIKKQSVQRILKLSMYAQDWKVIKTAIQNQMRVELFPT